jgi:alpha-galactosidase/6-phospho-beta-glucosidase family protein
MDTSQKQKVSGLSRSQRRLNRLLELVEKFEEPKIIRPRGRPRKRRKKIPIDHTHLNRFIRCYKIESGTNKIDNWILDYLYFKDWDKLNKETKYSRIEFFRRLAKHFKNGRYNRRRYFLLNMEVTNDKKEEAKKFKVEQQTKKTNNRKRVIKIVSLSQQTSEHKN